MIALALILATTTHAAAAWSRLADLPDREGFAGPFAGVSGGALIVGGGANFPEKKPWEAGARKVWYDSVFVLERADGQWKSAGTLPRPLGYGVSVTHNNSVICIGGSDADRHYGEVVRLRWRDGRLETSVMPPLPRPIASACGASIGNRIYVAGGQESPDAKTALATLFELDLSADTLAWRECEPCPGGGRILATAASINGDFYLLGGAELTPQRRYRTDAWRYRSGQGWTRLPDLPHAVVAAPSPAPSDATSLFLLGGDDGMQVGVTPPQGHTGFSKTILRLDIAANVWHEAGEIPAPRVTVPCVRWNDAWIIPNGERLPGVRSNQVWSFIPTGAKE